MKDKTVLEMYLEDMKAIKEIDERELNELTAALLRGDESARNRLIEGHMMYATGLIQPFIGYGEEISDLISESHLALTMAVMEYSEGDLKSQIKSKVEKRLREIADEEKVKKDASNKLADRVNELMDVSSELAAEHGKEASVEELAKRLQIPKDEVEELLKISLNAIDLEK
jgi:RNA polymerase sigma factor